MERIYHTWEKWECYPAGFYGNTAPNGWSGAEATKRYAHFLRDSVAFAAALSRVITEWKYSCEHYLSNENMNRIAWLGQSSACIAISLPASFRSGFNLLSEEEQATANALALEYLNLWLENRAEPILTIETAKSKTEMDLY